MIVPDEIARLKFIMTTDCNFRCDYCFEGGKQNLSLSAEQCVEVGRDVLSGMKQDELKILYFGGEPLLRFQEIQKITPLLKMHADKVGKRIVFTVITNGTIMSPRILAHLKAYHYFVSVSFDLHPLGHDTHRGYVGGIRNSSSRVWETMKLLVAETPHFCVSAVITRNTVKYMSEGFKNLLELGVRNFAVYPVLDNEDLTPEPNEYESQLMRMAELGRAVRGELTVNPPLQRGWSESGVFRSMSMSENSVNIELSPFGLQVIPEKSSIQSIDFGTGDRPVKRPASEDLRWAIIRAETAAAKYFNELRSER
jgi:sulfatase maturation enzyme AslB (radical SAM superfamily)